MRCLWRGDRCVSAPGTYAAGVRGSRLESRQGSAELRGVQRSTTGPAVRDPAAVAGIAPGTKVVDRWGPRNDAVPSWTFFWEADSDRAAEPGLILEVEQAATAGNAALSVYVANTVDAPQPQFAAHYPPPPTALATYPLSLAPYAKGRVSAVLARPVMAQRQLFTLLADDEGNASLGAWPLEAICEAALPAAAVELQRLALLVEPIRLKVQTLHHILLQSGRRPLRA